VIGSEQLVNTLRQRFQDVRSDFLPQEGVGTSSVHNTYIQVLAEAGLAGGLVAVFAMITCARRLRTLRRRLKGREAQLARSMIVVLGLTVVWLNDNALFGAQPESVLLAMTLGVLASLPAPIDDTELRPSPAMAGP
jgi:O-antigen ligase